MSSFQKRKDVINIPGTKTSIHNGQLIVSSGNPSLDHVIGGGIPVGSILLIEEDKFRNYSRVLNKYYLAEAVNQKNSIFTANLDENPNNFMKKIPLPVINSDKSKEINDKYLDNNETGDMRIAWRYNALPAINSEQGVDHNFGTNYDLTKKIDEDQLKLIDVTYWNEKSFNEEIEDKYKALLHEISTTAKQPLFSKIPGEGKNILRISIASLGSPAWYKENLSINICKFLIGLRAIVRNTLSVAFITIPVELLNHVDKNLVVKIRNLIDFSINLNSFSCTQYEKNLLLKDYHGFLTIKKLIALNTLQQYNPETYDLVFKLRRRRFLIEKLHLPPELQDSIQREQDDIGIGTGTININNNLSCSSGSVKSKLLDF